MMNYDSPNNNNIYGGPNLYATGNGGGSMGGMGNQYIPHGQGQGQGQSMPASAYDNNSNFLFANLANQGQALISNPAASMALRHGFDAAEQYVGKNISRFVTVNQLRYYFTVTTHYVLAKLKLLFLPFLNKEWQRRYGVDPNTNASLPFPPKDDYNAPDLYIPTMAIVTYVLCVGLLLGSRRKFSVDQLGMISSSALIWIAFEVFVASLSMYVLNIHSQIQTLDLLAYAGYKFVFMIVLITTLLWFDYLYFWVLLYCSLSLGYFLLKSMFVAIHVDNSTDSMNHGPQFQNKRRNNFLIAFVGVQVFLLYYLTRF